MNITDYLDDIYRVLDKLPNDAIEKVVEAIVKTRPKNWVFVFGNGGSASTASHFACDLDAVLIKSKALVDSLPAITARANDYGYEQAFTVQLQNQIGRNDVAIGISGSGNSPNVLNGMKLARTKSARTIGFTAFDGGKLKDMVDIPIVVPIHNMEQAEDIHLLICHVIKTLIRKEVMFEDKKVETVGFIAGAFDPAHDGHLDHAVKAAGLVDRLLISVTDDASVVRKKGKVCIPLPLRIQLMNTVRRYYGIHGEVIPALDTDGTQVKTLEYYHPDVYAKGGDRHGDNMLQCEIDVCEKIGTRIQYGVGDLLNSSTKIMTTTEV